MTSSGWAPAHTYDPNRRNMSVADVRLNRMLVRDVGRYATINEYAGGSGLGVDQVLSLIDPYLEDASLGLEPVNDQIFIYTAPSGRPVPPHQADVAPNLWELFRSRTDTTRSYELWKLTRSLEASGWKVDAIPSRICHGLGHLSNPPFLGIVVADRIVPVIDRPDPEDLAKMTGPVGEYERAGAVAVAVICATGALDATVTGVRRWFLSRRTNPSALAVVVLEDGLYNPVLVTAADGAVMPVAVSRETLSTLPWAADGR